MTKFYQTENHFWRNLLTRAVLILGTTFIILWFLPRTEGRIYHYDVDKIWLYPDLTADFDFSIFKSEQVMKAEKDSATRLFQPYFNWNAEVGEKQVTRFLQQYKDGIPGLPANTPQIVAKRLRALYEEGIIDPQIASQLGHSGNTTIRIVNGKEATSKSIDSISSTIGAYEKIFMDETLGPIRASLQQCNLNNYIEPNLIYDKELNETELNDILSLIPPASRTIMEGQTIVHHGDKVTESEYAAIQAFEKALQERNSSRQEVLLTIAGQGLYVFIFVLLFTLYLALFRKDYFSKPRSLAMLYVMIILFPLLTSFVMQHNFFSVYIIPFALGPIFIRVFMDSRTAFINHVTTILICALAVKYQYEFIIVQVVAGLVAIHSLRELSKRSQIFTTAILVAICSAASYFALQLIQTNDVTKLDQSMYIHIIVNGFFLLFAYPLMLIVEKTFGFVSTVTLFELSNTNNAILRRISEVAPGTFQHSITVGNLASEIANKIGAKSQLVRTGALYHDIGKMVSPAFFTENQVGVNPHDKLTDLQSASIIISHVTEGLKLAEKHNLPRTISDFIATHHGTGLTKYFYIHYKNEHPDEEMDESRFRYKGPNPFTREQAILMMCDAVEAASRSLPEYTEESIAKLVNTIINSQVDEGFFNDCPITFRDITWAKQTLIERLKAIYHTRIQYPTLKKEIEQKEK